MLKQFLIDIKLHKKDFLLPLCVIPACFLLGVGLCGLIMFTVEDPGTWVTFGTFMATIALVFFAVLNFAKYYQEFMVALSMGRTRTAFMVSYALRTLLELVVGYCLILVLYRVELAVGNNLFAPWPLESDPTFLMEWPILVALPALAILSMFIGSLYCYFGKKVLIPLWFVWMGTCVLGPRLFETEGSMSAVSQFLQSIPQWGWITAGLVAVAGMVATIIGLGKMQMVR